MTSRDRPRVRSYLEKDGYQVTTAGNGHDALFVAREAKPDLVVLDLQMPQMDGLSSHGGFAPSADIAIIMLTARVEEMDRILGLELGADDYVTKPFSPRELVARVHAVLRRAQKYSPPPRCWSMECPSIGRREVRQEGKVLDLTPTELDLLATLMSAPGRAFSRADLLEAVQGVAFEAYERTIDVHIKNLRQKLGDDPTEPVYIGTVRGIGYRFND